MLARGGQEKKGRDVRSKSYSKREKSQMRIQNDMWKNRYLGVMFVELETPPDFANAMHKWNVNKT
jgi:hypothetical protein